MTLETTDILAIIIALVSSVGLMLWTMRNNWYLSRENSELREQLIKQTGN